MVWKKKGTEEKVEVPVPTPTEKPEIPEKATQPEEREAVVTELPQAPARQIRGEDGNVYDLVTQNEAIQEILESVRELLKRTE